MIWSSSSHKSVGVNSYVTFFEYTRRFCLKCSHLNTIYFLNLDDYSIVCENIISCSEMECSGTPLTLRKRTLGSYNIKMGGIIVDTSHNEYLKEVLLWRYLCQTDENVKHLIWASFMFVCRIIIMIFICGSLIRPCPPEFVP